LFYSVTPVQLRGHGGCVGEFPSSLSLGEHPLLLNPLPLELSAQSSGMAPDSRAGEKTMKQGSRAVCSHCATAVFLQPSWLYQAFWNHPEHERCSIKSNSISVCPAAIPLLGKQQ